MRFIVILTLLSSSLFAQKYRSSKKKQPKVEIGVGVINTTTPHYPGSDKRLNLTLPFPTVMYRGDILRSDEDGGLRGRFLHSDHFEIK